MKNKTCLIEWLQPLPSSFPNRGWTWQIAILCHFVVSVNKLLWHHNFHYYHIMSYIYIHTCTIYIYIYPIISHIIHAHHEGWFVSLPSYTNHPTLPCLQRTRWAKMTWESQGGDFDHGKAYLSVHSESETPWKPSETFRNHSASSLTHSCKKLWNLISKVVQMAKNEETTGAHEDVEFWIPGTEAHHDDSSKRNITAASQAAVFVGVYISCFAFGISVLTVRAAVVTIHTIGAPPRLPEPCTWPRKSNHWTWEPPTDQKPIILTWFTPTAYAET